MSKPIVKQLIIKFGRKNCFTWTFIGDMFTPGLIMNAEGWWTKHESLALPDRRISVAHRSMCHIPTAWVPPLQKGCQLPRWCIAMRDRHILGNGDNESCLIQITEWMFKSYDCENAITLEFIILGLSYFTSFRLTFPVLSQPDMSNISLNQLSVPNSASLQFLHSLFKALASTLSEGCILLSITNTFIVGSHAVSWFIHSTWYLVVSHLLFLE